jgi:hypothetical protein
VRYKDIPNVWLTKKFNIYLSIIIKTDINTMALYDKNASELGYSLARMTGYFGSMAESNEGIPTSARIRMIQMLIQEWNKIDPESETTKKWVAEWEEIIEKLQAKLQEEKLAYKSF